MHQLLVLFRVIMSQVHVNQLVQIWYCVLWTTDYGDAMMKTTRDNIMGKFFYILLISVSFSVLTMTYIFILLYIHQQFQMGINHYIIPTNKSKQHNYIILFLYFIIFIQIYYIIAYIMLLCYLTTYYAWYINCPRLLFIYLSLFLLFIIELYIIN